MTAGLGLAVAAGSLALGVVVPWVAMRMLAPALFGGGPGVVNYRGRTVSPGLGVVWLVWSGCATLGGAVAVTSTAESTLPVLLLAGPLALVAFAAGMVDDVFGGADAKGFRGHLSAMAHGRLTTGGLKLVLIGASSLVAAFVIAPVTPWGSAGGVSELVDWWRFLIGPCFAGAAIALTSNLVNLTDLRPGRALKAYLVVAGVGVVAIAVDSMRAAGDPSAAVSAVDALSLLTFVVGPVLAVWGYDLTERGMLGDAGANPMGAVAGLLVVAGAPAWGLVAYTTLVFALNIVSERISFSRVIERSALLGAVDRLGRIDAEATVHAQEPSHDEAKPE